MAISIIPYGAQSTMFWVFLFGMCCMVPGKHVMTCDIKTTVLDTINLECHEITSLSPLELAAVCFNLDSCLGMKLNTDRGPSGMLCSCPNGPTWLGVPDLTRMPTSQFYITKDVIIPGKGTVRARYGVSVLILICDSLSPIVVAVSVVYNIVRI